MLALKSLPIIISVIVFCENQNSVVHVSIHQSCHHIETSQLICFTNLNPLLISLFQCFSKSNSKINQNVNLMSLLLTWNNIEMFLLLTFRGVFRTQSNVWDRNLCEIVEGYQSFSIFGKSSIIYVWLGSECTSDFGSWFCYWNWLKLISFIVKFALHVS